MNNISEGFERDNNNEFRNFLGYSKGSAGEVRSMLYIALDLDYISKEQFDTNFTLAIKIITQISNFKKYLLKYAAKDRLNKIKLFVLQVLKLN